MLPIFILFWLGLHMFCVFSSNNRVLNGSTDLRKQSLGSQVPHPPRLGRSISTPAKYQYLNGIDDNPFFKMTDSSQQNGLMPLNVSICYNAVLILFTNIYIYIYFVFDVRSSKILYNGHYHTIKLIFSVIIGARFTNPVFKQRKKKHFLCPKNLQMHL